ncbi:GNAT family N-acetyltransferase [Nocardia sp. NPDC050710]|uniref:GNAT family N-acetyltransferase n=1 Tax=Nocardia sp. NPDC050710 TaxID=3157220 RepID=UPI0033D417F6
MIVPRTRHHMTACVDALVKVHRYDRYPVQWPADPARWLTPANLCAAWVALDGEAVAGHIGLSLLESRDLDPAVAESVHTPEGSVGSVNRLFVVPGARGRAIAEHLLDAAHRHAAARNRPLVLHVSDEARAAIACYEKLGWRRVASVRATWLDSTGRPALVHHYRGPDTPMPIADSAARRRTCP